MDEATTNTFTGVVICVAGNSAISLALNVQKLAHMRLARKKRRPEESSLLARAPSPPLSPHSPHPSSSARLASPGAPPTDKAFLRSKLWWLGFCLLNLGELGNFAAYSFAPASLVAPLGAVALVANCFFGPCILGEPFHSLDLLGCFVIFCGSGLVVLSSRSTDRELQTGDIARTVQDPLFLAYTSVSLASALVLAYLSRTSLGDRYIIIDLGVCALMGAYTALSTKALASLIKTLFLDVFRYPVTYCLLAVLLASAVVQINFLNKSLQRFDSRLVIPAQFCSFSLSVIAGSAIVFHDFEKADRADLFFFINGCIISAVGVFVLTQSSVSPARDSEPGHAPQPRAASPPQNVGEEFYFSQRTSLPYSISAPPLRTKRTFSLSMSASLSGKYLLATPLASGDIIEVDPVSQMPLGPSETVAEAGRPSLP